MCREDVGYLFATVSKMAILLAIRMPTGLVANVHENVSVDIYGNTMVVHSDGGRNSNP